MKKYEANGVEISFDMHRCIHAERCWRGLGSVFSREARPWVNPAGAPIEEIDRVVAQCPSGALHVRRTEGPPIEKLPDASVAPMGDGPLHVRGAVVIENNDGARVIEETRVALCRCGASKRKPFCDNSHLEAKFTAAGCDPDTEQAALDALPEPTEEDNELHVTMVPNGPLIVSGDYVLQGADGSEARSGGALCRCGESASKPFCDGSHKSAGFQAE